MKVKTGIVKIIAIESREVPSKNRGEEPSTFLSFQYFDGSRNQRLWAFAKDFPNLPEVDTSGVFELDVRAKAGNYGSYLSARALSFQL